MVREILKSLGDYNHKPHATEPIAYSTDGGRLDSNFMTYVLDSVAQGKTQYTEAFRLTETNRATFEHYMNSR